METEMRRKFIENGLVQAVITFSLLLFCLFFAQNQIVAQSISGIPATIPPYDDATITVNVAIQVDNDTVTPDSSLGAIDIEPPAANDTYSTLTIPNINLSNNLDYVIGVLTNNSNEKLRITSGTWSRSTIQVENQSEGFAGGFIYNSNNSFRGLIYEPDNYISYPFSFDVTSAGEAVGIGFLGGGSFNGQVAAYEIKVESTGTGKATGISLQNLTNNYSSSSTYQNTEIGTISIEVNSDSGDATGVSINDVLFSSGTYNGNMLLSFGSITSTGGNSATGIRVNDIGNSLISYYGEYAYLHTDTITATGSDSAVGAQINNIGYSGNIYLGTSQESYSYIYGDYIRTPSKITADGGKSAVGVQINDIGYRASVYISAYSLYSDDYFTKETISVTGGDSAVGVQINNIEGSHSSSSYYRTDVYIGDIESSSNNNAVGLQINDIGGSKTDDTTTSSYYKGYTNLYTGDINSNGGDSAVGVRINDIGINPETGNEYSYNTPSSYEIVNIGNVIAEGGRTATGVQINNVGRGAAMTIGDVVAKSTSLSESGSVTGMQIGNVSSGFYSSSNSDPGVTINSVSAISLNESQGDPASGYSYDNVYGFVLAGNLVTEIDRSYYYDEVVGIGRVTITNGIIAERHGGSGDVIGLAMNGDPSGGTLTVGSDGGGVSISAKAISDNATGNAIGIALTRDTGIPAQSSNPSSYDPQGLVVEGSIYAEATIGDAFGIRVGDDAHPNVSLGSYTANSDISAYSDSGNAYGIYSYGGGNAVTVIARHLDPSGYSYLQTEIVGQTNNPDKEGASLWLGGKNNSLTISGYGFDNNGKPFTVYGAQTIELDRATLAGASFFEKNVFVDGVVSGIGQNIYDRQITITIDVPHIEKVTINDDFTLSDDGYFEGLTKEIVVTSGATVNFGKSQFTNRETVVENDELNALISDLKIGIKKNDLDRLLGTLTSGLSDVARDNLFNDLITEGEPDRNELDNLLADITGGLDNSERDALLDNLVDSLKNGISRNSLNKLLSDLTGGLKKDELDKLLDDIILEGKPDRDTLASLLDPQNLQLGLKNEEWAYLLDDVTKWLEKIAPVTINFKQDGLSLTQDGDVEMVTTGLRLTLNGTATFTGDQVFEGINGEPTSEAYIYGDAEFIGVGNFVFGGDLYAESVTVNKIYTVLAGSYASSGNYAPPAYIGTQEIGELYTGLLTVNTGTLKISREAYVGGIASDVDVNGKPITTGNIEGAKGSKITIDVDDGEEFVYGGSLQMDRVTKLGAGKQTVGRLKTSHKLLIDDGEFAVTNSAYIAGVQSGAGTSLSKEFSVGGVLTLDTGVTEIFKNILPSGRIRTYWYQQHIYNFDGNVTAQSITKLGRGKQIFSSIKTGLITFGEGDGNDDEEAEYPDNQFDLNNKLINVDDLIGAEKLRKAGELVATESATFTGIEGDNGKFSGGDFVLNGTENHSSNIIVEAGKFTKNGQGKQSLALLTTDLLTVNGGEIAVADNIRIVSGIEGSGGQITGKNITIGELEIFTETQEVQTVNGQQKVVTVLVPKQDHGTEIDGILYFPDNNDHLFNGNLKGYNVTKVGSGLQSFNKLETVNNLNITEGSIKLNQVIVGSQLSLAANTTLDLLVGGESSINATGELNGKIIIHGNSPQNTVAIKLGSGVDRDKFRIAFTESPDQFITWTLGATTVYAKPNPQAYMSESYLSSLLLHDHRSAWNAVAKRLNQMLPTIAPPFRSSDTYRNDPYRNDPYSNDPYSNDPYQHSDRFNNRFNDRFLGQSPYNSNSNKSLWVNYIGRTGEHKSTFNNRKFKLRADGIQVGYDIIPSQSTQFGLIFGYEGQSSTANQDTVNGDDTYIGLYGAKTFTRGFDLRAIVNYGHQAYQLKRYAHNVFGYNNAKYNGDTIEGILEVGKQFGLSRQLIIRPVFAVELYYNMINHTAEDDKFQNNAAVSYDVATLKQTLLRFGNDWRYDLQRLTLNGGFYYTFNCGTDKLTTIAANDFNQRLPLNGTKLGRSILSMDIGGQYYINELQTRSIFAGYSGNLYPDRKGTPISGTFNIGFQFDF